MNGSVTHKAWKASVFRKSLCPAKRTGRHCTAGGKVITLTYTFVD